MFSALYIIPLVVAFVMGTATGSSGDQGAYGEDIADIDSSEETTKLKFVKTDLLRRRPLGLRYKVWRVSSSQAVSVTSRLGCFASREPY